MGSSLKDALKALLAKGRTRTKAEDKLPTATLNKKPSSPHPSPSSYEKKHEKNWGLGISELEENGEPSFVEIMDREGVKPANFKQKTNPILAHNACSTEPKKPEFESRNNLSKKILKPSNNKKRKQFISTTTSEGRIWSKIKVPEMALKKTESSHVNYDGCSRLEL